VYGNTDIDQCTLNSLRVIEEAGKPDIPVARGTGHPLVVETTLGGRAAHHVDGLGGAGHKFGPPKGKPIKASAAQFIVDMVMASPGEITLVPVGPLTNIALALRLEPRIVENVKEVIIMGGGITLGNVTPVAEANIHNDPHAANIVFSAGWPLTMVGLDATEQVIMDPDYLNALYGIGNKAANFIREIVPFYQGVFQHPKYRGGICVHDSSAIACAIDKSLFTIERMPVYVETEGHCKGFTVPDRYKRWEDSTEIDVCVGVDSERYLKLYRERISTYQ